MRHIPQSHLEIDRPLDLLRRRNGRVATLTSSAPPVYLRPQGSSLPDASAQDQQPPFDDTDFRAEQAAALEPILNQGEGERRHKWLQIDLEIRKLLRNLHVNFDHPTTVTSTNPHKTRQGAKPEVITAAGLMACECL